MSGRLKNDYDVTIIDAIVTGQKPQPLADEIIKKKYKAVIFLTCSASFTEDFEFIKAIKKGSPQTLMIGNGGYLLMKGEKILKEYPFIDAVILDFITEHILDYLEGKRPVDDMITRVGEQIVRKRTVSNNEFSYPVPLHNQLSQGRYLLPISSSPKLTVSMISMGCRNKCTFCIPATIPYKQRNLENILQELEAIKLQGFKHITFHDFTFIGDRQQVMNLCKAMIERKFGLTWACQTRVDTVDKEILKIMRSAGCTVIEFGVESGDNNVLKEMNKGISVDMIKRAFKLTHEQGIRTVGFFIIGMPGETVETINKTISLAIDLDCDYASFSLPMPHPGTRLGESVKNNNSVLSERDLFDDVSHPRDDISTLDIDTVWKLRALAYRKFYLRPGYFIKRIFNTRSLYELLLQTRVFLSILKRLLMKYR